MQLKPKEPSRLCRVDPPHPSRVRGLRGANSDFLLYLAEVRKFCSWTTNHSIHTSFDYNANVTWCYANIKRGTGGPRTLQNYSWKARYDTEHVLRLTNRRTTGVQYRHLGGSKGGIRPTVRFNRGLRLAIVRRNETDLISPARSSRFLVTSGKRVL